MDDVRMKTIWPAAEGEVAEQIRSFDWAATPLGEPEGWPISLRTLVETMLASRFPKALVWGPELTTLHNDAFRPILGEKPTAIGRPFRDVWAESWDDISPIIERALDGHATFIEDFPLVIKRHDKPEEAYFTFCYSPVRDETGAIAGVLDTVIETTATVLTARATAKSNARLAEREAFLSSVLAASTDCIKVLDLDGNLTFMSDGGMIVMEVPEFGVVRGCHWPDLLMGEGKQFASAALEAARRGETSHFEMAANTYAGTPKWWSVSVSPIIGDDGVVSQILSVSRDHTALKAAREQQVLLHAELGHRMKNQLALVQAIVGQTLRSASDLTSAAAILTARIQVLARAHDILIAGGAGRTTVGEIVRQVVQLHDDRLASQFVIEGPPVVVASRPALSLALILHELSTNAAKYGALSVPGGNVTITWHIEGAGEQTQFVFHWIEQGGPAVAEPARKGSGSRLIGAGLSGTVDGGVAVAYAAEGLQCQVTADLTSFQTEQ